MPRIFIVDDDPSNREILRLRLESSGFEVKEAANGEEGLQVIQQNPPDLVIMDVMMPKMDGWNLCRKLKESETTKTIPVIMLTARSLEIEQLRGWEAGADEYLTKPCPPDALLHAVSGLLAKPQGGVQHAAHS